MKLEVTESVREELEKSLNKVVSSIGKIQIGSKEQFPFGWRKAAKGRTVWRILEEAITQNLEANSKDCGFSSFQPADSEVGVYDFAGTFSKNNAKIYVNIKSAVEGGRTNKDDISKAKSLEEFFQKIGDENLFIATFSIKFEEDMAVSITGAKVMPTAWLPDVYVNPSNNGNLQSSKYKDIEQAEKRTNPEFLEVLKAEILRAQNKKTKKIESKKI